MKGHDYRFRCPGCQDTRGFFGTFVFHEKMGEHPESPWHGKGYKTGDRIGYCSVHEREPTECRHEWIRGKEADKEHFIWVPLCV
jgi:hypothetical protein